VSVIDVTALTSPVSAEAPAGPDLEDDLAFAGLEAISKGKPEQQIGDTVTPAQEPEWREVKRQSLALLGRTRDLRVGVLLTQALVRTDGLPGFADGLALLKGWVEGMWDAVHPQLDPADPDPMRRKNRLESLNDAAATVNAVRDTTLVAARAVGRFSYRDILVATNKIPAPSGADGAAPSMPAIEAAFRESPLEDLKATADSLALALASATGIEAAFTAKVGAARSVGLGQLTGMLKGMQGAVAEELARRGAVVAGVEGGAGAAAAGAAAASAGQIRTRDDVVRMLDRLCEYFQKNEPSSPVPILLKRAQRLANKSFIDLVRDLAPNGVSQVELIRGSDE
jgi:type VI secretion system protein ImpA